MAENDKIPTDDYERELATDLDDDTPDKPKGMPLHTGSKQHIFLSRLHLHAANADLDTAVEE